MARVPTPLVIAVEGACYAGKTTLAGQLSGTLDGVLIPEYSDLAASPPFPPRTHADVRAALDALRRLEIQRSGLARSTAAPLIVFDRSPLSCIAFQYGVRCLGVPCDHRLACDVFVSAAQQHQIATPQLYIYLAIDHATACARRLARGPVAPHLMDRSVVDGMNRACRHFLDSLPRDHCLIIDGAQPSASVTEQALAFIAEPRTGPAIPVTAWSRLRELP
jgi:thymidylate kinase